MSSTLLGGDFTVYYKAENGQKRIEYSGSGTKHTVRSLYSALQDLFDELNQMDDEVPMTAQTPTEFTLVNGWFIDDTTTEYLYGGAIQTNGWATNEVVQVEYTETIALIASDIGKTISTASYSGTILDYNLTGATKYLWIRPDDPSTDLFDTAETFTVTSGTGTGSVVVSTNLTGECLWPNIYTIGSIADNTTVYAVQGGNKLSAAKATTDWWGYGHIDILVKTKNMGEEIDDGVLKVFPRRFGALYDNFEVDLSNGGRNPIPLATATDLNNANGYRTLNSTTQNGAWTSSDVGLKVWKSGDTTIEAVITAVVDNTTYWTFEYYLIGDPLSDFTDTDILTDGSRTETVNGAPANAGPATLAPAPSFTFTNTDEDLNNGSGSRPYSIAVDCQTHTLAEVYEYFKYITRRGSVVALDGTDGEQYIGSQAQAEYDVEVGGDMAEGDIVYLFQADNTLAAQGLIVADHETDADTGDWILRQVRYFTSGAITKFGDDPVWGSVTVSGTLSSIRTINPTKQSPLGTFAGGTMFAGPGVWLTNMAADQKYQLIDDDGTVQVPPTTVSVKISNTRALDSLGIFRLDGSGNINKAEYTLADSQSAGATSLSVTAAISSEAPKSGGSYGAGGIVRIIDANAVTAPEYRLRYTTFSGVAFTLFNMTGLTADGSNCTSTQLTDTGANFVTNGVKVGDLVRNTTETVVAYVTAVVGENELTTTPVTDWTSDTYEIGTLPFTTGVAQAHNGYVPFLDLVESTGTDGAPGEEYSQIIYSSAVDVRVRVRQAGDILPYEADNSISANGLTAPAIRNPDTIYQ